MQIDIPITNLEIKELIIILRKYPRGKVLVVEKNAVWRTELDLTDNNSPQPTKGQPIPAGNVFENMASNITRSFGG